MVKKFNLPRNFGQKISSGLHKGVSSVSHLVEKTADNVSKGAEQVQKVSKVVGKSAGTVAKITGNPLVMGAVGAMAPELLPELMLANVGAKAIQSHAKNIHNISGQVRQGANKVSDVANTVNNENSSIQRAKPIEQEPTHGFNFA